ncbi:MAG: DUF3822 family protein [Bacteroidaceae bacterium]|nr:DUF3822 family protein [Bacteroidaceae bacterium]
MPATGNKSYHPLSLSIRVYADGFSFFVCDPQTSSLVRGEHFRNAEGVPVAQQMMQELGKPDYFNRQIDQAYVLICSPSTRVPLEGFHRDEAEAIYAFTFAHEDMTRLRVAYTILPQLESVELYAIPRDIEETILQFYPTARFFASRAMLMERFLNYDKDVDSAYRRLYLSPEAGGFTLLAFDNGHLAFANTFAVSSTADALYFVLNVWQTLGLQAMKDHLVLCTADDELRKAVAEYLMHVDVLSDIDLFPRVPLTREKEVPADLKALLLNRL